MNTERAILINHLMEPPNRITGVTRFLFSLLGELVARKNFNYILATTWRREELPKAVNHPNLTVVTRRFYKSMPLNVLMQMITLPSLYRKSQAVLEFNSNSIGCIWPFWPRVITVHDCYFYIIPDRFPHRHRLWWKIFFPTGLAAASKAICVSRNTEADLHRFFPLFAEKTVVVHEASALIINDDLLPATGLNKPYAIYVGNVSPNKNPSVLAAALKILEQRGIPITVYHVGRDEMSLLSDAMFTAGLQHPAQSIGTLSDDALAAAYAGAVCFIVTSTHEGFCLPVLEAQTLGIPVIASDIPILREVAGEGALFFDLHDPATLARCLERVFHDPELHQRMAVASRRNALRFSWSRAAAETEAVFEQILEDNVRRRSHRAAPTAG